MQTDRSRSDFFRSLSPSPQMSQMSQMSQIQSQPFPWMPIVIGMIGLVALAAGVSFIVVPPISDIDPDRREQARKDYMYGGIGLIILAVFIWLVLAWKMLKSDELVIDEDEYTIHPSPGRRHIEEILSARTPMMVKQRVNFL